MVLITTSCLGRRDVFKDDIDAGRMNVVLCTFHVRRAMLTNLITKVQDRALRAQIWVDLRDIMYGKPPPLKTPQQYATEQITAFCDKYRKQAGAFVAYFEQEWAPKYGKAAVVPYEGRVWQACAQQDSINPSSS